MKTDRYSDVAILAEEANGGVCWLPRLSYLSLFLLLPVLLGGFLSKAEARDGVSDEVIRIGGVMDLKGRSRGLGEGMKRGIEAAIDGQYVQGRRIEFLTANDSYTPAKTVVATNAMLAKQVFVMIGNVGTPTAKVSLPLLAKAQVPALGFFTGAGLLRPGKGPIVNYRASYVQETAAVINAALDQGVRPNEVCAYVQNDAYGMAGIEGVRRALKGKPGASDALAGLETILAMKGENPLRNGSAPVGVYQRNTYTARLGYDSLKSWEKSHDSRCRVVVTVGSYQSIANFAGYSRYKGEDWVVSAVSFTGADNFKNALVNTKGTKNIVMTQVVPLLNSDLPIVQEARAALGGQLGYVSLEGYIVGKLFLEIADRVEGELTRSAFMRAVQGVQFDLGGLQLDFSDDNQGSDLVVLTGLGEEGWKRMEARDWSKWLQ